MHRMHLTPAPLAVGQASDEAVSGVVGQSEEGSIEEAAIAISGLKGSAGLGEVVKPAALVRGALGGAARGAVLQALVRVSDEAVGGGGPTGVAAGALSVLAAAVEHLGPQEAPAWAINAAGERMSRVLQAPHCPPDVRAAAGYAMGRLQQMGPGK